MFIYFFLAILTAPWVIAMKLKNNVGKNIILFPGDNDPPQGFKIRSGYIVSLSKTLSSQQTVTFRAIEDESRAKVLINGKESIKVTAVKGKASPVDVTLAGKFSGFKILLYIVFLLRNHGLCF